MANMNEDISVPSAGLLATASEAGMTEGQTCYVATYGDYFSWHAPKWRTCTCPSCADRRAQVGKGTP
jgi:hypothetical protein